MVFCGDFKRVNIYSTYEIDGSYYITYEFEFLGFQYTGNVYEGKCNSLCVRFNLAIDDNRVRCRFGHKLGILK
jgi:hypothetical protein